MTAATADEPIVVTEPGVYEMSNVDYHLDPVPGGSLSSTGARKLLPPSCPALFKWEKDHPSPPKKAFDFGHAAHDTLLGGGPEIVVIPDEVAAKDGGWSTKEAKAFVAQVRARGAVPLKPSEAGQIAAMAAALRAHPVASRLLDPDNGTAEASLFWTDEQTGVKRRSRLDLLPHGRTGRMIIPDYKSAVSADPEKFARAAMDFGYHQQAPFYCDGVTALGLAEDPVFVFVVQEKTAPYLVSVVQLDVTATRIGQLLNRRAIELYAQCKANNHWPSYSDEVEQVSLPFWYERQYEQEI